MTLTSLELLRKQSAALITLERELTSDEPNIAKVQIAVGLFEEVRDALADKVKE